MISALLATVVGAVVVFLCWLLLNWLYATWSIELQDILMAGLLFTVVVLVCFAVGKAVLFVPELVKALR